jgi:hypothetical protein
MTNDSAPPRDVLVANLEAVGPTPAPMTCGFEGDGSLLRVVLGALCPLVPQHAHHDFVVTPAFMEDTFPQASLLVETQRGVEPDCSGVEGEDPYLEPVHVQTRERQLDQLLHDGAPRAVCSRMPPKAVP